MWARDSGAADSFAHSRFVRGDVEDTFDAHKAVEALSAWCPDGRDGPAVAISLQGRSGDADKFLYSLARGVLWTVHVLHVQLAGI